jgi:plastocyanin
VGTDSGAQSGLVPAVGGPVTWHLVVGAERASNALQGLGFYPAQITIDVGDTISWTSASDEPHTVTFLAPGGSLPPPNSPSAALPAGGTTEDGSTFTSSGFIFKNQSYSLTFTKAGAYTFYCIIHQPEMVGAVIVHSAGSAYPKSQPVLTALGTGAASRDLAAAQVSITRFPYEIRGTHLTAGIAPGLSSGTPSSSTVLRFLDGPALNFGGDPEPLTVAVGTTVTWTNQSNNEPHTVAFPPAGQTPPPTLSPFSPPSGGSTYDGTTLVNSGVILPGASFSLTFTKAGTYTYFCLFHDDEGMVATIIVK